jgi:hypothetical protein
MLKNILMFLATVFIVTFLLVSHTTVTNLMWLSSMDMPVTISILFTSIAHDMVSMNGSGAVPAAALVAVALLIAFAVARIALKWINISRRYAYAIAGGCALFAIVLLMPLAFYNLDIIAGARSAIGKVYLIATGALGGYYFGFNLSKKEN